MIHLADVTLEITPGESECKKLLRKTRRGDKWNTPMLRASGQRPNDTFLAELARYVKRFLPTELEASIS
jgi:hypothetical protein